MAYNEDVIVINIKERGFNDILEKVKTLNSLLDKPWAVAKGLKNEQGISRTSELIEKSGKAYDKMWDSINKDIDTTYDTFQKKQEKYEQNQKKLIQTNLKTQRQGYRQLRTALLQFNLSIMFFGMQMQRTFQGIAQSSLTTFNKLNADTEAANNTVNRLSAGMEGLYYVIGDAINSALETMEPLLSNILQYIVDFVDQNQSWIGFAIIIGIIVGAIMMFVGQLGLLFVGIAALKGGLVATGAAATTTGTAVAGAGTTGAAGIWSMLAPILAVIALWGFLIALFTGQEWARKLLVTVINVMGKIIVSVVYTFARIIELATGAVYLIGDIILDVIKWAFTGVINFIIDKINWLIRQANKIPGVNIREIGEIKQESLGSRVSNSVDFFMNKFVKNSAFDYDKGLAMVDKFTGYIETGLEVMFAKDKENADTQAQAAEINLSAAQLNYQASQNQWNALMASGGTTATGGSVTSGMNNGTLNFGWSSVVGGSTA